MKKKKEELTELIKQALKENNLTGPLEWGYSDEKMSVPFSFLALR